MKVLVNKKLVEYDGPTISGKYYCVRMKPPFSQEFWYEKEEATKSILKNNLKPTIDKVVLLNVLDPNEIRCICLHDSNTPALNPSDYFYSINNAPDICGVNALNDFDKTIIE